MVMVNLKDGGVIPCQPTQNPEFFQVYVNVMDFLKKKITLKLLIFKFMRLCKTL